MIHAAWKSLLGRKLRLVMSAMAIVLGVAFVSGSLIFTDMLSSAFNGIATGTLADLNVQAKGQSESMEQSMTRLVEPELVEEIRKVDGVQSVEGFVSTTPTYLIAKNGKVLATQGPPQLGMSWIDGKAFGDQTGLRVVEGRKPAAEGEIAIDPPSLRKSGYAIGDTMKVVTTGRAGTVRARIVGTATWGENGGTVGATYALFDPRTAQKLLLDGRHRWTGLWVVATPGANLDSTAAGIRAVLPADLEVERGDTMADRINKTVSQVTGFISTFLLVFAGIALVVGSFLIVNTFSILIAQRSRELALFRALGASRGQVRRSVVFEALVVGLIGSTLGLVAGLGIAYAIAALFSVIGLEISGTPSLSATTVVASYLVGMVVTLVAASWPAWRAANVPPVAAMTGDVMTGTAGLGRRAAVGVAMAVTGLALLAVGLFVHVENPLYYVGAGALLTLLGVAMASPVLGLPVTAALGSLYRRAYGTVGTLAHLNSVRNPRRTAATASALMIGLTLVTAMSTLGSSMKASTHDAITKNLRSDYLVSSVSFAGFSPSVGDAMAKVPGVEAVHRMRYVPATIDGERTRVVGLDRAGFDKIIAMPLAAGSPEAWKPGTAVIGHGTAEKGTRIGDVVHVEINGTTIDLPVVGILTEDALMNGVVTPLEGLSTAGVPATDSIVAVTRATGSDPATVRSGLDAVVADLPMVTVTDQGEYAAEQAGSIDTLLMIVYGLLALAIVIAILGIVNTLGLSVVERTREIGLLRAIGLGRGQLRRMVRLESVVIALLGSVLGLGMGLLFGVAIQRSQADNGLDRLVIPWPMLAVVLVVAVVVGILAALWPAHRAARLDVLAAISAD